jgi:nucleoside 2-deoxyribosyltransferase
MNIYIAGPLFSQAQQAWLADLKLRILELGSQFGTDLTISLPQEFILAHDVECWGDQAGTEIFKRCTSYLRQADLLIAVLDGSQVDDGTAWELGYFFAGRDPRRQPIIGIRTDFRPAGDGTFSIINSMIEHSCDHIVRSTDDLLFALKTYLESEPVLPG